MAPRYFLTGTIQVRIDREPDRTAVLVFPDRNHFCTYQHKSGQLGCAIFLEVRDDVSDKFNDEIHSIVKPLTNGAIELPAPSDFKHILDILAPSALRQSKVEVTVQGDAKDLTLVAVRMPAPDTTDQASIRYPN